MLCYENLRQKGPYVIYNRAHCEALGTADMAAVRAGVTLPWSQGPIEGQINRLKMLKRQMFSCALVDLLARRFLLAA
jgi:transposase